MNEAPAGQSAWRKLFSVNLRPRASKPRRILSPIAWSRTSATPITSAIASRVMSSCVGPSPPHRMTASLRESACRMVPTIRAWLSPTFTWKWESMPARASRSPIHDELVSTICPSSNSVPTATISQRIPTRSPDGRPCGTAQCYIAAVRVRARTDFARQQGRSALAGLSTAAGAGGFNLNPGMCYEAPAPTGGHGRGGRMPGRFRAHPGARAARHEGKK